MAVGCVGVDLVDLEGWKERSLQIVRSSPDPARSFKFLRDKVKSLFGLGDLRLANKHRRRSPGHASSTLVTSAEHDAGREDRSEERTCCIGPVACVDAGVAAAAGAQVCSLGKPVLQVGSPGVHCHQPCQLGRHSKRQGWVPLWSSPLHGMRRKSVCFDGGLVHAGVLCVRAGAISLLKIDFFVKWLQWNITWEGKIKKCITRRVKMRMFAIAVLPLNSGVSITRGGSRQFFFLIWCAVCTCLEGAGKVGADEVDQSSSQWSHFICQLHECVLGEDLIDGHGGTKMASLYGRSGLGLYAQGDRKHPSFGRGGAQSSTDNILMSRHRKSELNGLAGSRVEYRQNQ